MIKMESISVPRAAGKGGCYPILNLDQTFNEIYLVHPFLLTFKTNLVGYDPRPRASERCQRRLLGLGRHVGFHSPTCQHASTTESKAAAKLQSRHHRNWGKNLQNVCRFMTLPSIAQAAERSALRVHAPAAACPPGPGQLQPGCFQIQTLLQSQMQKLLMKSEERPMVNFHKDQQSHQSSMEIARGREARGAGKEKATSGRGSRCFLPCGPGSLMPGIRRHDGLHASLQDIILQQTALLQQHCRQTLTCG